MSNNILRENQVEEMAYPSSFNFDEFRELKSFSERVQYCEARLKRLSSGSARIAYQVDNEKVLKLAKNQKGVAQNVEEANSYAIHTGIGAQVFDYDDDGLWVEMELARKAKPSDFKRLLGVPFTGNASQQVTVCGYIDDAHSHYTRGSAHFRFSSPNTELYNDFNEKAGNYEFPSAEWFISLYDYMANTGLESTGDLKRISSWGIVSRDGAEIPVLIDMGLSDEVQQQYYSRSLNEADIKVMVREAMANILQDYILNGGEMKE